MSETSVRKGTNWSGCSMRAGGLWAQGAPSSDWDSSCSDQEGKRTPAVVGLHVCVCVCWGVSWERN